MAHVKEAPIQKAIIDYLTFKRHFFWRNNSGAFKAPHGSFIRFGALGSPDIFLLKEGKLWGIEVKSPTGQLSPYQETFGASLGVNGGKYLVARSVDDVIAVGL